MHPNFPDGEYLLTEKVSYYLADPSRGDVVVFKPPFTNDDEFIKRIIALPGERVSIRDSKVYINGQPLAESYLSPTLITSSGSFLEEGVDFLVPQGKYVVLGDNRPHSSDSRTWGAITKKDITGKAWLTYWPTKSAGVVKKPTYDYSP